MFTLIGQLYLSIVCFSSFFTYYSGPCHFILQIIQALFKLKIYLKLILKYKFRK